MQDTNAVTLFTDRDIHLFKEGNHFHVYEQLGAHPVKIDGVEGTYFAVWAPNAERVAVIGDFNNWNPGSSNMNARNDGSGIWEVFIPSVGKGTLYKYRVFSKYNNYQCDKGDPYAFAWEGAPKTASRIWDLAYDWNDKEWMDARKKKQIAKEAMSIYEVHLGSWKRVPEEGDRFLTYRELAKPLADYVTDMGFTHIEFMPVMEHPFYGSWGYQTTGYFAPTSRYGTPQDFMYLVDYLHQRGIGVLVDWVPSHFASDGFGLVYFDGTHLYEHADNRLGFHPEWKSYIFNYGRNEIRNFLISNAIFWLDKYHIDGLRVDAVASMLYLDYARKDGEWLPNEHGGRENTKAINFIKRFNEAVYGTFPDVHTIAEESTAWAMVSRPVYSGGLGFGMKWNMGWMHDTLEYFSKDPIYRKHHHNQLTFSIWYAFYENFVLPFSHDEVVHGKGSLLRKMPGDEWQRFANLRLLLSYMYAHPGKKLLFMGCEFGQYNEWYHERSLDWHLLDNPKHKGVYELVKVLNGLYKEEKSFHQIDFANDGFAWIDHTDWQNSVATFLRRGQSTKEAVAVACNFTPTPRPEYRLGVPFAGTWKVIFNSDDKVWGGSGMVETKSVESEPVLCHGRENSIRVTLPPLGALFLRGRIKEKEQKKEKPQKDDAQAQNDKAGTE